MEANCLRLEKYKQGYHKAPPQPQLCARGLHGLGPRPDPTLSLVAKLMFGSGPGSNNSNQTVYIEHFGLSRTIIFFAKGKLLVFAFILRS
jgi:hypothetical protein